MGNWPLHGAPPCHRALARTGGRPSATARSSAMRRAGCCTPSLWTTRAGAPGCTIRRTPPSRTPAPLARAPSAARRAPAGPTGTPTGRRVARSAKPTSARPRPSRGRGSRWWQRRWRRPLRGLGAPRADGPVGGGPWTAPPRPVPRLLPSFVGRERELADVRRLLTRTRLLTLTGPGGAGKSRLALETSHSVQASYPDGVWPVELAALADAVLVPQALARALGVRERPGWPPVETLVRALASRRLLLVLDNCEHLLDACARAADALLRACPGLRVLATSREPLGVGGEVIWRMPPLADAEAVLLFAARAAAVRPGFAVTAANAAAVVELCRRLDGLPLAIELAAARTAALSVEEIAARLDDRLRLLTCGSRTAAPRHQTLRAAIDWSHDLLTDVERTLLRRLAVFAGGWTLAAAEEALGFPPIAAGDVLDLLARLVAKSLVVAEERGGATRYRLLETVRRYAAEELVRSGEDAAARERHRDWCVALAAWAGPALVGADQQRALERLDDEQENVRSALAWCVEHDSAAGLRLAAGAWRYWRYRGHLAEGRRWLETTLAGTPEPSPARAQALLGLAYVTWDAGDLAATVAASRQSRRLFRAAADRSGESHALCILGMAHLHLGELPTARQHLTASLALARTAGDGHRAAVSGYLLGHALSFLGDDARARRTLDESVATLRAGRDRFNYMSALWCLGQLLSDQGDGAGARAELDESRAISRSIGEGTASLLALGRLGQLAHREGNDEQATLLLEQALTAAQEHGFPLVVPSLLTWLARAVWRRGDRAEAGELLREALRRSLVHDRRVLPGAMEGLALVAVGRGEAAAAARLFGAAEALRAAQRHPRPPPDRPDVDAAVQAAREALGAAGFGAARAEGARWSPERAVGEALGTAAPIRPEDGRELARASLTAREQEVASLIASGLR